VTDVPALCAFFEALSPDSRYYRFFSAARCDCEQCPASSASERGRRNRPRLPRVTLIDDSRVHTVGFIHGI
jgi:hypothetical protein